MITDNSFTPTTTQSLLFQQDRPSVNPFSLGSAAMRQVRPLFVVASM
jgi:hypothetical protein